MEKMRTTLLISFLFFGLFLFFTHPVKAETIRDFSSTINVLPDSSILVKEKINYDFQDSIRHGIFRIIPLLNSNDESMEVKVVSVTNELDQPYKFTVTSSPKEIEIKIGDPNEIISGIKEFHITYQVFGSITYYDDLDEIYWNVTGNEWEVIIEKAEAKIILPNNVFPLQQACYYGESGSISNCKITDEEVFATETLLNEGEGLTVAVGFPKGVVSIYERKVDSNFVKFTKTFWPMVIPIAVFIFMFLRWFKKGRDPKGAGVIIPQYDVPDNLTPLEVGGIINGALKDQNISAEIIYLATQGYLKIKQIDCDKDNFLCLISEIDYELTLLKERGLLDNDFDRKIITALFGEKVKVGGTIKLSGLKKGFHKSITNINNSVIGSILRKGYYKNFPEQNSKGFVFIVITFIIGSFASLYLEIIESFIILILSILLSMLVWFVFYRLMPARSKKGILTKEYLLGFKEYLQIAEKNRLNFHNAPDKKPEVFEKLLPYAMVFGVEKLWAKEFEDIYVNPPEWYVGQPSLFSAIAFSHEMSSFNTVVISSISPTSSSGGSGGGGSSGGGGGGGGGGSW